MKSIITSFLYYNGSDYDVFVDPSYSYPDTSLSQTQNVTTPGWDRKVESHNFNNESLTSRGSYESKLKNKDTLIVFIFNADSLELLGWDYIKSNYVISQRYELSLIDLSQLNWHLSFPPSSEMRNIKMWPPYGTYDANGNRVK